MKTDYDVIIIGAGPAGASSAKVLKEAGLKTLIVEKRNLPRYKCCGGLLSYRCMQFLSVNFKAIPESIYCKNKKIKFKLSKSGNTFFNVNDEWHSVARHLFDKWLLDESKTEVFEGAFYTGHSMEDGTIKVNLLKQDKPLVISCRYLIGADGGNSPVRRNIDTSYRTKNLMCYKQTLYEGKSEIDPDFYYFILGKKYTDMFACFCVKDDMTYIGTTFKLTNNKNDFLRNLHEKLENQFNLKVGKIIRTETCISDGLQDISRFNFGKGNILLAGESSGLLTNFGEGITSALISGKAAAESVIEAINTDHYAYDFYLKLIGDEKDYIWKYFSGAVSGTSSRSG